VEITIFYENNKIKVSNNDNVIGEYSLEAEVNLTSFVEKISESEKEITVTPMQYEVVVEKNNLSEDTIKLLKYIYSIIEAFNDSYRKVIEETV